MKKWILFIFFLSFISCAARAEDAPFTVDRSNLYDGMSRPYGQGYAPSIKGNTMTVVLPLISDAAEGDITATLTPANPDSAPFKLKELTVRVARQEYNLTSGTVNAYVLMFRLSLYPSRANGEYPIVVDVSGRDANGGALTQRFELEAVVNDGTEGNAIPHVAVERLEADRGILAAGEEAVIRLTLRNTSTTRAVSGITVRFTDATGDILPAGADAIFVGRLAAGEAAECEIPVRTAQKAAAQFHSVELALDYTYANGIEAASQVKYTVDVRQPVRLEYSEAALPSRVTQGDIPSFSMTLMNMGKSQIDNVLLSFDVPGLSNGGSVLVGTIEPGDSKSASTNFHVAGDVLGAVKGTLRITYEDPYGETHAIELPLNTVIEEKVVSVFAEKTDEKEKTAANLWIPYAACAVLFALLILQRMLLQRKIRMLEERHL